MRDEILVFSQAMEAELRENDHKHHWSGCSVKWLLNRLRQETAELTRAIEAGESPERILSEAADVANFAMMIADNYRHDAGEDDGGAERQSFTQRFDGVPSKRQR